MAELRTGAGSYEYPSQTGTQLDQPFDPLGNLQNTNNQLRQAADTAEAQRTMGRLLDYYLPALVQGQKMPNDNELAAAIAHARGLLRKNSLLSRDSSKLEASVTQLESLRSALKAFMKGDASYADIGAALNNVQVALRAAGLLPNASRNPFNSEAAKVPENYASREFLLSSKWSAPDWVLVSNNNRDIAIVNVLDQAAQTYRNSPTPENWKAFEQARNHLNKYFNNSRFLAVTLSNQKPGQHNGKLIQERIVWANEQIGLHHLANDKAKLAQLAEVYLQKPTENNEKALRKQMARVSDLAIKAGENPLYAIRDAEEKLKSAKPVESNVTDPRDSTRRAASTFVGAAYPGQDGLKQQTRIVEVKKGAGQAATVSYLARGLFLTDAQGVQRGTPQDKWVQPLPGAKTVDQAIAMAQANFRNGKFLFPKASITTGSVAPVVPTPMPSQATLTPRDASKPLFATGKAAIYAEPGTFVDGDRDGKIRAAIDDQIAPSAARFASQSLQPVQMGQGDTLLNNIGLAMNLVDPSGRRVPTEGNPLEYKGETLEKVRAVYNEVVRIGGSEARLNVLPVYMEQANGKMLMAPLFKVQRADGQGVQYLDTGLRKYDSLEAFKNENKLPCQRLYVPHKGQLVALGADRKPQRMQFDVVNNERFVDKAISVTRGVVGGGATVLAIGSAVLGGGALVPPLLIGAGVTLAGMAVADQWDRFQHGQTLSFTNPEARSNYFDMAGVLGVASLKTAGQLGKALAVADTVAGVAQQIDGTQQLVRNWNEMSAVERSSQAAVLAFFGTLTVGSMRQQFSPKAVYEQLSAMAGKKNNAGPATEGQATAPRKPAENPPVTRAPDTAGNRETSVQKPENAISPVKTEPSPEPVARPQTSAQKPLTAAESARLGELGIDATGMVKGKPLGGGQILQLIAALKASASYKQALDVLAEVSSATGIKANEIAQMKSISDALSEVKNRLDAVPSPTNSEPFEVTATTSFDITASAVQQNKDTFLSRSYPPDQAPWKDTTPLGYGKKIKDSDLIDAAYLKAKASNPNLDEAPWFRDLYLKYIATGPSDANIEAYILRTDPLLANKIAQQRASAAAPTSNPQTSRPITQASQNIDGQYQRFKAAPPDEYLLPSQRADFVRDMQAYLAEIKADVSKINSIYAEGADFQDTFDDIRYSIGSVSTADEAKKLILRAECLKFDVHLAQAQGNGRAADVGKIIPITVLEKEILDRYNAKVSQFNQMIDDLNLRSGDPVKAKIPGWQGDEKGEVKLFEYDIDQDLLTVNSAAAMDILMNNEGNEELAAMVNRIYQFTGRTGENSASVPGMPGMITRRVRLYIDAKAPPPLGWADGLVTTPTGRQQTYKISEIDRQYTDQLVGNKLGMSAEEKEARAQELVNYARRWWAENEMLMSRYGMSLEEVMTKRAQDSTANAIGHLNSRLETGRRGGATSGLQVNLGSAAGSYKDDVGKFILQDLNERRAQINPDPNVVPKPVYVRYPANIEEPKLLATQEEVRETINAHAVKMQEMTLKATLENLDLARKNFNFNHENHWRNRILFLTGIAGLVATYNGINVTIKSAEIGPNIDTKLFGNPENRGASSARLRSRDIGIDMMLHLPPDEKTIVGQKTGAEYDKARKKFNEAMELWKNTFPRTDWNGKTMTDLTYDSWVKKIDESAREFGVISIKNGLIDRLKTQYESLTLRAQVAQSNYASSDPKLVAKAKEDIPALRIELGVLNAQRKFAESWLNEVSKELLATRKNIGIGVPYVNVASIDVQQQVVKDTALDLYNAAGQLSASGTATINAFSSLSGSVASANVAGQQIASNDKNAAATQYPPNVSKKLNEEFSPKQTQLAEQIVKAQEALVAALTEFGGNPSTNTQAKVRNAVYGVLNLYQSQFSLSKEALAYLEKENAAYQVKNGISNTVIQAEIDRWKTLVKEAQAGSIAASANISNTSGPVFANEAASYNGYVSVLNDFNTQVQNEFGSRVSTIPGPNRIKLPPLSSIEGQPRTPLEVATEMFQKQPMLFKPSREAIRGAAAIDITLRRFETPEDFVRAVQASGLWLTPETGSGSSTVDPNQSQPSPTPTTPSVNTPRQVQPTPGGNTGL